MLLFSCESQKQISLYIIDSNSHKPLDSVLVEVNAGIYGDYSKSTAKGYTNAAGKFETSLMIGCTPKCYDIKIRCSKNDYQEVDLFNQTEDTVVMFTKAQVTE
jgi:5-hydroxyisourate hydrolase-like protein (transthyretin family)